MNYASSFDLITNIYRLSEIQYTVDEAFTYMWTSFFGCLGFCIISFLIWYLTKEYNVYFILSTVFGGIFGLASIISAGVYFRNEYKRKRFMQRENLRNQRMEEQREEKAKTQVIQAALGTSTVPAPSTSICSRSYVA